MQIINKRFGQSAICNTTYSALQGAARVANNMSSYRISRRLSCLAHLTTVVPTLVGICLQQLIADVMYTRSRRARSSPARLSRSGLNQLYPAPQECIAEPAHSNGPSCILQPGRRKHVPKQIQAMGSARLGVLLECGQRG